MAFILESEFMNRLLDIGLKRAGEVSLVEEKLAFDLGEYAKLKPVLYAFVEDDVVWYVGKSINSLKDRLSGYRNANKSQPTNKRIQGNLVEAIKAGRSFKVYFLSGHHEHKYGQFKISLPGGLEDDIIFQLKPKWNDR